MPTTVQQTPIRTERDRWQVPINPASVIHQGDMVVVVAGLAQAAAAAAGANFIGVADDSNPVVSLGDTLSRISVVRERGAVCRFNSTSGDSYSAYDAVYIGADAQTVTKIATGSTAVGFISPGMATYSTLPIAGGAGVYVDVFIIPTYPAGS